MLIVGVAVGLVVGLTVAFGVGVIVGFLTGVIVIDWVGKGVLVGGGEVKITLI